jgi:hypothetical protein
MAIHRYPLKGWTEEQKLAFRSRGIGGSEIASVPGISLNSYKSGIELFLEKIGEPVFKFKGNRHTNFGKIHEKTIANEIYPFFEIGFDADRMFENREAGKIINIVEEYPYKIVNDKYPQLFAELDRKIVTTTNPGVLECKNTTSDARRKHVDGVDPSHICQLQQYMMIEEWSYGHLAYHIDGNNADVIDFGPVREVQEGIEYFSAVFWQKVLKARKIKKEYDIDSYYGMNQLLFDSKQKDGVAMLQALEPDLTGESCEVEFLRKYIKPTAEYSEMPGEDNLLDLARKYYQQCEALKQMEKEKERLANEIIVALGGIHVAIYDNGKISYKKDAAGKLRLHVSPKLFKDELC